MAISQMYSMSRYIINKIYILCHCRCSMSNTASSVQWVFFLRMEGAFGAPHRYKQSNVSILYGAVTVNSQTGDGHIFRATIRWLLAKTTNTNAPAQLTTQTFLCVTNENMRTIHSVYHRWACFAFPLMERRIRIPVIYHQRFSCYFFSAFFG